MKTHPILFSSEMIHAILTGKKTMTRRTKGLNKVNQCPEDFEFYRIHNGVAKFCGRNNALNEVYIKCPYGTPGDILWVRETFQHTRCLNINPEDDTYGYVYKADRQPWKDIDGWKWKPGIHMPKEAARIFLKITDVGIERICDISDDDAIREGIISTASPRTSFKVLWEDINGPESWGANPWVWVVSFERIRKFERTHIKAVRERLTM